MSQQQNIETIQEVYAAFGRGDVAFIVAPAHDGCSSGSFVTRRSFRTSSFTILHWRPPSDELVGLPTAEQTEIIQLQSTSSIRPLHHENVAAMLQDH
jgi:ketosteroid isomerase-like protein